MAIVRAIFVMTRRRAASNSGSWSAGFDLDIPFAIRMHVSFVDWSPSTETMFMESSRMDCHVSAKSSLRVASVVIIVSVVPWSTLTWGSIIPLPLEMAAMYTRVPSLRRVRTAHSFLMVSVVMIASQISLSASRPTSSSRAARDIP